MLADDKVKPMVVSKGEGRALWLLGALINFKALGSETGGRFWALEGLADYNMAVPLHAHSREDEVWYVLGGEIPGNFDLMLNLVVSLAVSGNLGYS